MEMRAWDFCIIRVPVSRSTDVQPRQNHILPCSVVHTDIPVFSIAASYIEKEFIPAIWRLKFRLRSATSSRENQRIIMHAMLFHRKKHIGFILF